MVITTSEQSAKSFSVTTETAPVVQTLDRSQRIASLYMTEQEILDFTIALENNNFIEANRIAQLNAQRINEKFPLFAYMMMARAKNERELRSPTYEEIVDIFVARMTPESQAKLEDLRRTRVPRVTIFTGLPGSGKSTFAQGRFTVPVDTDDIRPLLAAKHRENGLRYFSADNIVLPRSEQGLVWDLGLNSQPVIQAMQPEAQYVQRLIVEAAARQSLDVDIHTPLSNRQRVQDLIESVRKINPAYEVGAVLVHTHPSIAWKRNLERSHRSVPPEMFMKAINTYPRFAEMIRDGQPKDIMVIDTSGEIPKILVRRLGVENMRSLNEEERGIILNWERLIF